MAGARNILSSFCLDRHSPFLFFFSFFTLAFYLHAQLLRLWGSRELHSHAYSKLFHGFLRRHANFATLPFVNKEWSIWGCAIDPKNRPQFSQLSHGLYRGYLYWSIPLLVGEGKEREITTFFFPFSFLSSFFPPFLFLSLSLSLSLYFFSTIIPGKVIGASSVNFRSERFTRQIRFIYLFISRKWIYLSLKSSSASDILLT